MSWKTVPWRVVRRTVFRFRKAFGMKNKPNQKKIVVEASPEQLERFFRKRFFRESWFLSYYYKGEDMNLCRAEFKRDEFEDYQLHIRVFKVGENECEIYVHFELDPIQYPDKHVGGVNYNPKKGRKMLKEILSDSEFKHQVVE